MAINWSEKKLRFKPQDTWRDARPTFGHKIGLNSQGKTVLFGVVENSSAAQNNLEVGMEVISVDTIDFSNGYSYCDYIDYVNEPREQLTFVVLEKDGNRRTVTLHRALLK